MVKHDLTNLNRNQLEEEYVEISSRLDEAEAKLKWFEGQMRLAKHQKFGATSEKSDSDQMYLFNETEISADSSEEEPVLDKIHKRGVRKKGNKEYMTEDLPTETIEYRLSPQEQICPECSSPLHEMSKIIHKELTIIPAKVLVKEHVRYVYACRNCEKEGIHTPILKAPMPKPVIANSLASPSLIAYILCRKYEEAVPLYRQEQQMHYYGLEIKRQNLANWLIYSSQHYLVHLYERMHQQLLEKDILHADETTVQVLHEDGKTAESNSYMWMYRTGKDAVPIVLYEYQPGRGARYPLEFLKGFKGYLHVDGYEAYKKLTLDDQENPSGIKLAGCWAHYPRSMIIREGSLNVA